MLTQGKHFDVLDNDHVIAMFFKHCVLDRMLDAVFVAL